MTWVTARPLLSPRPPVLDRLWKVNLTHVVAGSMSGGPGRRPHLARHLHDYDLRISTTSPADRSRSGTRSGQSVTYVPRINRHPGDRNGPVRDGAPCTIR